MSRYCLDTSAYIQFRRGDPQTTAAIDGASWLGFPGDLLWESCTRGFCLTGQREEDSDHLRDFLAHPAVESIPVDDEVARQYGRTPVRTACRGSQSGRQSLASE